MTETLWANRQVIVCGGTGGVGKTTASAALAMAAAVSGLRVLVMTIDPARRLAHALGLTSIDGDEHQVDADLLLPYGVEMRGSLHAMMPDVKRTFDALIKRYAPSPERADSILQNRIYQHFSSALAGSHEYAAVEKLYEVHTSGKYDLIVLDTPPAQNALDFLDAPGRIIEFLESDALQWLKRPSALAGRLSMRVLGLGSSFLFKTVGKFAGVETLRELSEFLSSFSGMYDGFRERSQRVRALLRDAGLAFVLVGTTGDEPCRAMWRFSDTLAEAGLQTRGLIINRVRTPPYSPHDAERVAHAVERLLGAQDQRATIMRALQQEMQLAMQDQAAVTRVRAHQPPVPVVILPELALDAHDLASLASLHRAFL